MLKLIAYSLATTLLTAFASAQATRYVDPVNGSNATGDGSMSAPYATLQFAIDQGLDGDEILLMPGVYSPGSNGEQFPVALPAYGRIAGFFRSGVKFVRSGSFTTSALLRATGTDPQGGAAQYLTLENMDLISMSGVGLSMEVSNEDALAVLLKRTVARTRIGVRIQALDSAQTAIEISDSQIRAGERAVILNSKVTSDLPQGPFAGLDLERSLLVAGGASDVVSVQTTGANATATAHLRNSVLVDGVNAVRTFNGPGAEHGVCTVNMAHCAVYQSTAGVRNQASAIFTQVSNTIFSLVPTNIPGFSPSNPAYVVDHILTTDPALRNLPTNVDGVPIWSGVDPQNPVFDDFHLVFSSPGIDQGGGNPGLSQDDMDGDLRASPCQSSARDIGPDGFDPSYIRFESDNLVLGGVARISFQGPPNGTAQAWASFGLIGDDTPCDAIGLAGTPFPLGGGPIALDPRGTGAVTQPTTPSPVLLGLTIYIQALYFDATGVSSFSNNVDSGQFSPIVN